MKIVKIKRNKHLGMVSAFIGILVTFTAPDMFTLAGGVFLLVTGVILWWMNN